MIQEFIKKWDSRKDFLREHLEACKGENITYSYLVEKIFKIVINDIDRYGYKNFDTEKNDRDRSRRLSRYANIYNPGENLSVINRGLRGDS